MINALNASPNIVEHLGHGSVTINAKLSSADVAGLTNAFPFFMYSQACYGGAVEQPDSIAKAYVASPHGAFAVIMNSGEGWYNTSGGLSLSHSFARSFWDAVFHQHILNLGEANEASKEANLWQVGASGAYRYIYFETNLLGDPETPLQIGTQTATPGVTLVESGCSTNVTEGRATDTYTVVLTSLPAANVTVTATPGSQINVDKTTLTFTAGNWNVPQTVTVSAPDDHIGPGTAYQHNYASGHQQRSKLQRPERGWRHGKHHRCRCCRHSRLADFRASHHGKRRDANSACNSVRYLRPT